MATIMPGHDLRTTATSGHGCAPVPDLTGTAPRPRQIIDTLELEALFAEFNAGVERARRAARWVKP